MKEIIYTVKRDNSAGKGFRQLIATLVWMYFKDLKNYLKNPELTTKFFTRTNNHPEHLIEFWEKDAYVFLQFLYGSIIAKKILEKITPQIEQAKRIFLRQNALFSCSTPEMCEKEVENENIAILGG